MRLFYIVQIYYNQYIIKTLSLIALILIFQIAKAQTIVSGKIKDGKGHPVPGVSITIKNSFDGATSDSSGNFRFSASDTGHQVIRFSSIGYRALEQPILLQGKSIQLYLNLKEEPNEMKAVTITAGSFSAGDSKRGAVLSSLDVATTAGSNADITAALKTLPGAQQVGEQEGLFVRGGTSQETKQFIDGSLVANPYYTSVPDISTRGRFSPFLFKGTVFSTGGYSALYGQALSSVVLLESIDLPEKSEVDASISPIVAGVGTQQLARDKKSSWGVSYNYVNVGLYFGLVKQTPDYFRLPQFHSGDANFRIKTKNGGMIKYYTTFNYNQLGLRRPDVDSAYLKNAFDLGNHNWYNNLSWREILNNGWKMNLSSSYSTNLDDIHQQLQGPDNKPRIYPASLFWMYNKNFVLKNREDLAQTKAVFEKKLGGLSALRFGGEYWYDNNHFIYQDTSRSLKDNMYAAFAETDIYLTNELAAKIGLRYEYSSLIKKPDLAPRISLAYKTGKDAQISAAYGIFYQKADNQQLFYTSNLGFTQATHYIINYQKMTKDQIFRVEAYYKKYKDLIKTIPINYYYFNYNNNGSADARGIEFFWRDKKTFKNFDYWISYSYLDTKRDYLNYPGTIVPNFASKNTVSLVMKRFITDWKTGFNLTYTYASGRPYYDFMINSSGKYYTADQGYTKDYNSLNFSMEYVPSIGKKNPKTFVVLFASMSNVLGYNAVYGYNYSFNGQEKQAIEPPAQRFYFIGCFLSWGVDRTQDAINNNL
ncbi:MAG: TonB-dependent receptor [Bacteroidota bacterium]|nr:TonB-dependent receptor [Bacteroidota bacterium]MDP4211332.1 TonB-dependent receptor [Bacteroidota bacterium]MDP4250300.1 TonB-dependent receptor [Bacteroidota bacterium]